MLEQLHKTNRAVETVRENSDDMEKNLAECVIKSLLIQHLNQLEQRLIAQMSRSHGRHS